MNEFLQRYKKWGFDQSQPISIPKTFRVHSDSSQVLKILTSLDSNIHYEKIPYLDFGYEYAAPFSLSSTPQFLLGQIYIQDAASQIPVQILSPTSQDSVLDVCASPGSKTTQISQYMKNSGFLVAIELQKKRIERLLTNLDRFSVQNAIVIQKNARKLFDLQMTFTKILVDAPCSGNFVIDKDWFLKRSFDDFKKMAHIQKEILANAVSVLEKGGKLVYSTCSLEIEENEEVVEFALKHFGLKLIPININVGNEGLTQNTKLCKRFWPFITNTQGFFIAYFEKQ